MKQKLGRTIATVEMQKETYTDGQVRLFKTIERLPKSKVDIGKETNDGKTTIGTEKLCDQRN